MSALNLPKMSAPTVQTGLDSRVPNGTYNCRIYSAEADTAPKGYARVNLKCEIITPDVVTADGVDYQVAGRKFTAYVPVDPQAKQYGEAYQMFSSLGFCNAAGEVDLEPLAEKIEAGEMFVYVTLKSEQQLALDPVTNQPILHPATGQPLTRGWRIGFVGPREILGPGPVIEGLPPVVPF